MCRKCKWQLFAAGTQRLIDSERLPKHRNYLRGVLMMIQNRQHVSKAEAQTLAKFEREAGLDRRDDVITIRPLPPMPELNPVFKRRMDELMEDTNAPKRGWFSRLFGGKR